MLLEGVPIDERQIRQLAALLPTELAKKLTVASTFGSQIVALTHREQQAILMALERSSERLDEDLRLHILRQASWRRP